MLKEVLVPDIGSYKDVEIIEIAVSVGDTVEKESALITLETEKAALEVPCPFAGVIKEMRVKVGDKISEGSLILILETTDEETSAEPKKEAEKKEIKQEIKKEVVIEKKETGKRETIVENASGITHAGPGVRRFARELGVDLSRVKGTGRKARIVKGDIQAYVKAILSRQQSGTSDSSFNVLPWPETDFTKFGLVERKPLSRIKKLSGAYLHRNWVMVPHVTQFDEADMTELEAFRKEQQGASVQQGVKLTPLVFMMKAVVAALKEFPNFNASFDPKASELVLKQYYHIGVAVDTPGGLVVPVVRKVDQKGIFQLAKELAEISLKAREGRLSNDEMQGSSFTISSLGGIGGTAFTPIINVPDVAILGVSKAQIKPVFDIETQAFKPCLKLPLSLSYDHRVIDGAEGARFITFLAKKISEIRLLLL
jgi:pyruvate dehydrogenase E2 component (dihydrolipoamide acetyltransferase)